MFSKTLQSISMTAAMLVSLSAATDVSTCTGTSRSACPIDSRTTSRGGNGDQVYACNLISNEADACETGYVSMTFAYEAVNFGYTQRFGLCLLGQTVDEEVSETLFSTCLSPDELCGFGKVCPVSFCAPITALKSTIRWSVIDRAVPTDEWEPNTVCATEHSGTAARGDRHFDNQDSYCAERDTDKDGINDCGDNYFLQLEELLSTETGERVAADVALQASIAAEKTAREAADNALQVSIAAESASRIAADELETAAREAATGANADAIEAERNARIAAIEAERIARIAADEALRLDLEAELREIEATVVAEQIARIGGDVDVADLLSAERDARVAAVEAAELAAEENLDELSNDIDLDIAGLNAEIEKDILDLSVEIDGDLAQVVLSLAAEANDRIARDIELDNAIAALDDASVAALGAAVDDAIRARAALQTAIETEVDERKAGDSELQGVVDGQAAIVDGLADVNDNQHAVLASLQTQVSLLIKELAGDRDIVCAAEYEDMPDEQLLTSFEKPIKVGDKGCRVVECVEPDYRDWWAWWYHPYNRCECRYSVEYLEETNQYGHYGLHTWSQRATGCVVDNNSTAAVQELRSLIAEDYCFGFPCPLHEATVDLKPIA